MSRLSVFRVVELFFASGSSLFASWCSTLSCGWHCIAALSLFTSQCSENRIAILCPLHCDTLSFASRCSVFQCRDTVSFASQSSFLRRIVVLFVLSCLLQYGALSLRHDALSFTFRRSVFRVATLSFALRRCLSRCDAVFRVAMLCLSALRSSLFASRRGTLSSGWRSIAMSLFSRCNALSFASRCSVFCVAKLCLSVSWLYFSRCGALFSCCVAVLSVCVLSVAARRSVFCITTLCLLRRDALSFIITALCLSCCDALSDSIVTLCLSRHDTLSFALRRSVFPIVTLCHLRRMLCLLRCHALSFRVAMLSLFQVAALSLSRRRILFCVAELSLSRRGAVLSLCALSVAFRNAFFRIVTLFLLRRNALSVASQCSVFCVTTLCHSASWRSVL